MAKVIVVPSPAILAAMTYHQAAATAAAATAAAAPTQGPAAILEARRTALVRFARSVARSPAAAVTAALAPKTAALAPKTHVAAEEPLVLPAVSAIVMDGETVDREALESSGEARVYDNVRIRLVDPVAAPAGTGSSKAKKQPENRWHLQRIRIQRARKLGLTGKRIVIGVLDTGIDDSHPEFAGKTIHFAEFDADGKALANAHVRDAGDHGTHVSGLLAGRTVGVAPDASLAMAAVLTQPTSVGMEGSLAQILAGLNWLLATTFSPGSPGIGVDVLNASLGTPGYHDFLYQALATYRVTAGTQMFAAIGNAGAHGTSDCGSPGNYDIVIGVGATNAADEVAAFSDWGPIPPHGGLLKPDLCAPGVDVWSAAPGGGYRTLSGTSMASPIAAGVGALLLERNPAYDVDAAGLKASILTLVSPLVSARAGRGRLDLTNL